MKIIFTSTVLYGILDYILLNKNKIKYNNFPFQLYFTAIFSIALYLVIYLPLYKIIGENIIISISLLLIIYIISQYISYNILKEKKIKILNNLLIPILIISYLGFIYLTYNPIKNYIFYDKITNTYGIEIKKE